MANNIDATLSARRADDDARLRVCALRQDPFAGLQSWLDQVRFASARKAR